jgi:hypothetical protein
VFLAITVGMSAHRLRHVSLGFRCIVLESNGCSHASSAGRRTPE